MKFNLPQPLPLLDDSAFELKIGNVYRCKGGGKTAYWIVIAFDDRAVNLVGVNREGVVTSTANYGRHVFERSERYIRQAIGRCEAVESMDFDIVWYDNRDDFR